MAYDRKGIMTRYQWQFCTGRPIDNSVPDAWLPVLVDLFASIDETIPPAERAAFYWLDIKEKHGGLAVDYVAPSSVDFDIESAIEMAIHSIEEIERNSS